MMFRLFVKSRQQVREGWVSGKPCLKRWVHELWLSYHVPFWGLRAPLGSSNHELGEFTILGIGVIRPPVHQSR
jgi:hypothetical protein